MGLGEFENRPLGPVLHRYKLMPYSKNPVRWLLKIRPAFLADLLKITFRIKRQFVNTEAGKFLVDPASVFGDTLLCQGVYEPAMEKTLKAYLKPGGVFVDIGANEGYFSALGSRLVGNSGKVFAIEPQRRLQPILRENLRLNKCSNVTVIQAALSSTEGEREIYLSSSVNTGSSGLTRMTKYFLPKERVQSTTLTHLFKAHGIHRCDLAKIDAEGAEGEILEGAEQLLRENRIAAIALEFHPSALATLGRSAEQIHAQLIRNSYIHFTSPASLYLAPDTTPRL